MTLRYHPHTPGSFTWYHRDEVYAFLVFLLVLGFFSRSFTLAVSLLCLVVAALGLQNLYRLISVRGKQGKLSPALNEALHRIESRLAHFHHDRSRILISFLAVPVLSTLFYHRWMLWLKGGPHSTPTDRYWALFLGWYLFVWIIIFVYLLMVWWKQFKQPRRLHIKLLEGLVGSMFFYHGLPTKSRWITFVAALVLGGVPSYFAVQIAPEDPHGTAYANWLISGVVLLTVGGALYTMGWLIAFEARVEREEDQQ